MPENNNSTSPQAKLDSKFDINEGAVAGKGIMLPGVEGMDAAGITNIAAYQQYFENFAKGIDPLVDMWKSLGVEPPTYAKATTGAPLSAFNFARISLAPDSAIDGGLLQWPGLNPDALRKIARENIAPQLIIGMRCDDVLRYAQPSQHPWKPGWRFVERSNVGESGEKESKGAAFERDAAEAERFLLQANVDTRYTQVRERDADNLTSFARFLSVAVRDSLTYDSIAVWTEMDHQDRVKKFALLPAGNIRRAQRGGYKGNPKWFAAAVDEGGVVIQPFTRDELTLYVRNPRSDPDIFGYGYPEIEIAIRLIQGFQNALELNISIFDKSSIAQGILTLSGGSVTARQLDLLNRLLINMKRGITKAWALPVVGLPDGAKLEVIDLTRLKGNEAMYKEFINMLAGALCTLWRFPVRRFGYRISGGHRDAEPIPETTSVVTDQDDPGLPPLLGHIELLINEYLIWTRWPHLQFQFCGKSPAEDAREYEARMNARTWDEARAEVGLPPLEKLMKLSDFDEEEKKEVRKLLKLLGLIPNNPNHSGAFQAIVGAYVKSMTEGDEKDLETSGNLMNASKDPARSQQHGKQSGVRRDSAAESARSDK